MPPKPKKKKSAPVVDAEGASGSDGAGSDQELDTAGTAASGTDHDPSQPAGDAHQDGDGSPARASPQPGSDWSAAVTENDPVSDGRDAVPQQTEAGGNVTFRSSSSTHHLGNSSSKPLAPPEQVQGLQTRDSQHLPSVRLLRFHKPLEFLWRCCSSSKESVCFIG